MATRAFEKSGTAAEYYVVRLALKAYRAAIDAARSASEVIGAHSAEAMVKVDQCEQELDQIEREMDEALAPALAESSAPQVRELLACLKFVIDLERIGDLLSSATSRVHALGARAQMDDVNDLLKMCAALESMLAEAEEAFISRDTSRALTVLRRDAEIDRLRNLVLGRHLENLGNIAGPDSIHIVCAAEAVERAGDHAKNLAEETCHLVSGHTVRHLLRANEKSDEQMFIEHLRRQHLQQP